MDRHPRDAQVAVVGAGPIGLTLAGRLAQRGVRVLLLEQAPHHQGEGSKALCMQRETLEIWERLGIGQRVADRGIQWSVARTYFRSRELFSVKLPDGEGDHFPAFVNISQTEVEELLIGRLEELSGCQVRWGHRVIGIAQDSAGVAVRCETPEGERTFSVDYLVGTDGAHSSVRHLLGMGFPGHSHEDLFLICDIRADLPFPRERRFFFDPPWNPGRQVLVHPQPDGVWRIDWQVPPGTDADAELTNGGLDRRIRAIVGDQPYELLWMTAYHFHQRMVERFRAGRVLLAGDAAHLMSPFGARGLNSGAADAENLAWKLAAVLSGDAPERLLNSYHAERRAAAVENLAVTEATMRFMVPHGPLRRVWRDVVLRGSVRAGPLRRRVNSGRLAQPFAYAGSPVIQPGPDDPRLPAHGDVAPDAACALFRADPGERPVTRLRDLVGHGFLVLLACGERPDLAVAAAVRAARLAWPTDVRVAVVGAGTVPGGVLLLDDVRGELASIYAAAGPRAWLIRPDGHLAGSLPLHAREAVDGLPGLLARAIGASAASAPAAVRPAPRRRVSVSAGNRAGH